MFFVKCHNCSQQLSYKRKSAASRAEKNNILCESCKQSSKIKLERKCSACDKILLYKTAGDFNRAELNNSSCPSCAKKISHEKSFSVSCSKCGEKHFYKWKINAEKQDFICKICTKSNESLIRKCPECLNDILYKNRKSCLASKNKVCDECSRKRRRGPNYDIIKRACAECNIEITYSNSNACARANKQATLCKSCTLKINNIKPNKECLSAAIIANTGRVHSAEEKERRASTFLQKYGASNFLDSKHYKNSMIDNKHWINLGNNIIPSQILNDYNLPRSSIYKNIKSKNIFNAESLRFFCDEYKVHHSGVENMFSNKLELPIYNNKCHDDLRYRPDFKVTDLIYINVDGLYWHSEIHKNRKYHFNMRQEYENLGLRILQFRENEVSNKIDIIKSIVNNLTNKTANKVGARKCVVKIPTTAESIEFLNANHIKGYKPAKNIGLYYNDELIALMSYFQKGNIIKIDRFCSKLNTSIAGGFSKLLKEVEKTNTAKNPIHYWVDLRYGTGSFLLNNGFQLNKDVLGWDWTDFNKTYNRLSCRANMDSRGLSQRAYSEELKLHKIYDAGQRLYIKKYL